MKIILFIFCALIFTGIGYFIKGTVEDLKQEKEIQDSIEYADEKRAEEFLQDQSEEENIEHYEVKK